MVVTRKNGQIQDREKPPKDGTRWGKWVYRSKSLILVYEDHNRDFYEIDLEKCRDAAEILNWLLQISHKYWISPEDIGNLLLALDDLARGDLQADICPMGLAVWKGRRLKFNYKEHLAKKLRTPL